MSKQMHLGVFVQATGYHVSGWRVPEAETGSENLALLQKIAAIAERGKFDLFFLADGLTSSLTAHPSTMVRFEPTTLLGAIAMSTRHIGLAATVSTTYSEPYQVARTFASLITSVMAVQPGTWSQPVTHALLLILPGPPTRVTTTVMK